MLRTKRGQISVEYLIVIGFVVFIVIGILGISFFYASGIRDRIKTTQLDNFVNKILSSAESVYFAGEPSKITITAYLPAGVTSIQVLQEPPNSGEYVILISIETGSGLTTIAYTSDVPLTATSEPCEEEVITCSEGLKKLQITASSGEVSISQE